MTGKQFKVGRDKKNGVGLFDGDIRLMYFQFSDIERAISCVDALKHLCNRMNELNDDYVHELEVSKSLREVVREQNRYELKVKKTLQEAYELTKESYVYKPDKRSEIYIGQIQRLAILGILMKLADELGVELE